MSTNANLPAGFIITSIKGKRCTQVPRSLTTIAGETSFATTTTEAAAHTTTSSTPPPPPETTTSSAQVQGNSPQVTGSSASSTSSAEPTNSIASTPPSTPEPASETSTSSIPPPAAATTSVAPVVPIESVTPAAVSSTSTSENFISASPASKGTTPTVSSITSLPIAQSEVSTTPTSAGASGLLDNGTPSAVPSSRTSTSIIAKTSSFAPAAESSAAAGISSNPKLSAGPVAGGIIGGFALLGMITLLLWLLRRRRRRDSLVTPLTTGSKEGFYEIDRESVGPTRRRVKWKAVLGYQAKRLRERAATAMAGVSGIGASLKSKVVGDQSDTPSVNLNRGNSQFLDGPIPQHSRNNSSALSAHTGQLTVRDRFNDWWERFTDGMNFNWRLRQRDRQSMDPFASARSMTEQQANINRPLDFSQLLGMDNQEWQLQAERRRASLSQSPPQLGSLGLDFEAQQDPFADPAPKSNSGNQAWKPPHPSANPFADPIAPPSRSIPKQNTYISDTRRSRGLSMETTSNPPSTNPFVARKQINPNLPPSTSNNKTTSIAPTSRYPSSIAPTSRDSYRDTVFSSFSVNARKGKGRSDPFDLERPELWRPSLQKPPKPTPRDSRKDLYPDLLPNSLPRRASREVLGEEHKVGQSRGPQPRVVSQAVNRVLSEAGTYGSKYSSGLGSEFEWGDPGPDVGIRRSDEGVVGSVGTEWDRVRKSDNVSPVSLESMASSKGGVGKAM